MVVVEGEEVMTLQGKVVLVVFAATQLLDAGLTYAGITRGFADEGNPLIASLIPYAGLVLSLCVIKSIGIAFGTVLAANKRAAILAVLTFGYWVFAIYPWTLLLRGM